MAYAHLQILLCGHWAGTKSIYYVSDEEIHSTFIALNWPSLFGSCETNDLISIKIASIEFRWTRYTANGKLNAKVCDDEKCVLRFFFFLDCMRCRQTDTHTHSRTHEASERANDRTNEWTKLSFSSQIDENVIGCVPALFGVEHKLSKIKCWMQANNFRCWYEISFLNLIGFTIFARKDDKIPSCWKGQRFLR